VLRIAFAPRAESTLRSLRALENNEFFHLRSLESVEPFEGTVNA
jgi:hypothetical protein